MKFIDRIITSLVCFILFCFAYAWYDSDYFWHVKGGMQLLDKGFPTVDHLSWIAKENDYSWMMHEWLTDAIYAIGHRLIGDWFHFCFAFLLFAILFELIARHLSKFYNKQFSYMVTIFSFFLLFSYTDAAVITSRPQVISLVFFAVILIRTEAMRQIITWKDYVFIFVIMVVWVNLHGGSSLIGVAVTGILFATSFIDWIMKRETFRQMAQALGLLFVSLLAEVINPYGIGQIVMSYHILSDPISKQISEWKPTLFNTWDMVLLLCLPFILIIMNLLRKRIARVSLDLFNIIFVFFMMYHFLGSIRHAAMFGLSILILFAGLFKPVEAWVARVIENVKGRQLFNGKLVLWTLRVFVVVMAVSSLNGNIKLKNQAWNELYPSQAIDWIQQNPETRLFNNYNWGGFLLYHGIPTFVDGRTDIYMTSTYNHSTIFADYLKAQSSIDDFYIVTERYKINRFLLAKETNKAMVGFLSLQSNFEKVYEDNNAIIFDRKL